MRDDRFNVQLAVHGVGAERLLDNKIHRILHHAEIKEINGVMYMNDGDWVESCTALVEHHDGRWEIITWTKEKDNDETL